MIEKNNSSQLRNIKPLKTKIISNDLKVLRFSNYDTIKSCKDKNYLIDTDTNFVQDILHIAKTRANVLTQIFTKDKKQLSDLECDQIDFKANLHYRSNVLNENTYKNFEDIHEGERCNCGCQRGKGKQIPLLSDEQNLNILGSGIILLFMFKRTLVIALSLSVAIYAIFALITNLLGNSATSDQSCIDQYCHFRSQASQQNKLNPSIFSVVQSWIGVFFCIVWMFALRFIKFYGKHKNKDVDQWMNSSSDYTIAIENLPYGQYEQEQLIAYLRCLKDKKSQQKKQKLEQKSSSNSKNIQQSSTNQIKQQSDEFNMKSIQIVYNMGFSRKLIQNMFTHSLILKSCYQDSNDDKSTKGIIKQSNIQRYRELKRQICQTYQLLNDLRKKFLYDQNFRRNLSTTVAIIQFIDQNSKTNFLKEFGNEKIGILKQIQENIKALFFKKENLMFKGRILKIQRAPQPSDILFQNCQKKYSLGRILLIYLITFTIILFSFTLMIFLFYIKDTLKKSENDQNETLVSALNIVISISLQVINSVLWFALFYLLQLEYNHTLTQKIISQMNKVLVSTSINIIALPILTNYVIRNNIYGSQGLAGMVFDYQVSILTVGLIAKLIQPPNAVKRIILNIRFIRNYAIRFICKRINLLDNFQQGVEQINKFYEGSVFDVAGTYVYIMAAVYQAVFFCQLQPTLLFLVTIMVFLFYWVNKVKLLRMCKIPQITEILVFETALSQAAIIPIIYGSGTIVLSYIQHTENKSLNLDYTTGIISIGIGLFSFFNPGDILNKIISWFLVKFHIFKQDKEQAAKDQKQNEQNSQHPMVVQNLSESNDQKFKQQVNRFQDYYKHSNSLDLFGFQYCLLGKRQEKIIKHQLQQFCGKFFNKHTQNIIINIHELQMEKDKQNKKRTQKISI